jgi:hypothetical protein
MNNHNDALLEQLADKGDGICSYVDTIDEARKAIVERFTGAFQTIARDVKVQVEFDPAQVQAYRLLGYENRAVADQDFRNDRIDAGEVGAGHQVTALYEIERTNASSEKPLATVRLRWKAPRNVNAPAANEEANEIASPVLASQQTGFEGAGVGYRRAAVVAQFAEFLRRSVHARGDSLDELIAEADKLVRETGDSETAELDLLLHKSRQLILNSLPGCDDLCQAIDAVRRNSLLRCQSELLAKEMDAKLLEELEAENQKLEGAPARAPAPQARDAGEVIRTVAGPPWVRRARLRTMAPGGRGPTALQPHARAPGSRRPRLGPPRGRAGRARAPARGLDGTEGRRRGRPAPRRADAAPRRRREPARRGARPLGLRGAPQGLRRLPEDRLRAPGLPAAPRVARRPRRPVTERHLAALRGGSREDAFAALVLIHQLARACQWSPGMLARTQHAERLGGLLQDWLRTWGESSARDPLLSEPALAAALLYGRVMRIAWKAPLLSKNSAPYERATTFLAELTGVSARHRTRFGEALAAHYGRAATKLASTNDRLEGFEEEAAVLFPSLVGDCE